MTDKQTELEKDIEREKKEIQKNQDDYFGKGSEEVKDGEKDS